MSVAFVVAVAVLLGLVLFLYNEVRRSSGPAAWGRAPVWPKRLRVTFAAITLLLGGVGFWAFLIEPGRLVVHQQTIELDNWPQPLDGLRVAVISDIHVDNWFITEKKLRTIVERTNQLQPDLIVILGDYMSSDGWVTRRVGPEVFGPILKDLRAPLGVYSVLGNHDSWYSAVRVRRGLEQNGIKVLENEAAQIDVRGTSLWLIGLADLWTRPQRIAETVAKVPEGQPLLALTHNPDIFPDVPPRVQLVLAGHTHGGQVRFPLIGAVIESSKYGDRWERGHVFENNHHLFVTTGIGTSIVPVRFGVPPEIVLLTLKSRSQN
ncbi:MAG TPA: metallophosphoesterase [Pyrinomonadaceae bacterium]|nr:metallophosphoesterase [Pyrinomonadaceae bacterium]